MTTTTTPTPTKPADEVASTCMMCRLGMHPPSSDVTDPWNKVVASVSRKFDQVNLLYYTHMLRDRNPRPAISDILESIRGDLRDMQSLIATIESSRQSFVHVSDSILILRKYEVVEAEAALARWYA